ncbi:MAG: Cof-type HAD-IIB family hydrolase [Treponema sp.]|jgi:Cof subfamily protein (haloacid dehalogenase superfamily)|nr:Cof-type HAD-IIB family hydrolase [Treponema sp.]
MNLPINPASVKALALDLDGTVLGPGAVLSDRTRKTINACREKGLQLIVATGRAIEAAERFRIPLGAEGPMVYFNGAVVADMPGARILNSTLLGFEVVDFCIDLARSMGAYYQVFFPGTKENPRQILMAEKKGAEREMYFNHTGIQAEIGDLKEAAAGFPGCIKSMFVAEPEVQDALRPKIEGRFGNRIYIARTLKNFLEIMDCRVSKGQGLRYALECRGLKPEEVIAFGDEENDIPMFEAVRFSAAPASAKDTVKARADLVIGPNTEDGVAVFLEEFFGI